MRGMHLVRICPGTELNSLGLCEDAIIAKGIRGFVCAILSVPRVPERQRVYPLLPPVFSTQHPLRAWLVLC